jgi:hypothetical protein
MLVSWGWGLNCLLWSNSKYFGYWEARTTPGLPRFVQSPGFRGAGREGAACRSSRISPNADPPDQDITDGPSMAKQVPVWEPHSIMKEVCVVCRHAVAQMKRREREGDARCRIMRLHLTTRTLDSSASSMQSSFFFGMYVDTPFVTEALITLRNKADQGPIVSQPAWA